MKEGPDIARLGSVIGDPARANILTALMNGQALTARELALEAGITAQTASTHLSKLEDAGLLKRRKQGRHRYFAIADEDVGQVLEAMMGLAAKMGQMRTVTGPKDPALRKARVCYNHLAGELGVHLFDSLIRQGVLIEHGDALQLTETGKNAMRDFGVEIDRLSAARRPMCRACLDWSDRRTHLAGALGTALLDQIYAREWAKRVEGSRIVAFSKTGERMFRKAFPL